MEVFKSINIKTPILLIKALWDSKLAIIDKSTAVRIVSTKDFTTIEGFKSNITHEYFTNYTADVSIDGQYSLSKIPGTNNAALFSVEGKKLLYKIVQQRGAEIESVALDPLNRYSVTGSQDGKVAFWALKTSRLVLSLPAHTDYVTAMAFSDNGQWFASGSFDRSIMVLNMSVMRSPIYLKGAHNSVVVQIAFLSNAQLFSLDKEGNALIWNLRNGKVLKRLPKMHDEVRSLALSSDKRFAFVGTKLGYIGLYDLKAMELIQNRYLKEKESIASLSYISDGHRLAVGTHEGNVNIYSLFGDESHYMDLITKRQFKSFYDAVAINPMICFSKPYDDAERIWSEVVSKAKYHLERKERDKARDLLSVFSEIPSKKTTITQLMNEYEKFVQFQANVQDGKYSLAYSMAKQYPSFMESDLYFQMEQKWKKLFSKAQEIVLKPSGEEEARTLLAPFRGISEKTILIQQMFAEKRLYDFFKKLISQRDFLKVFELIKNNPFLKEFPEYSALMEYADKLYIQSQISFLSQEWSNAKKASETLIYFPDYSAEAQELLQTIKIRELFSDAIITGNLSKAFGYLNTYPMLYDTPDGISLEKEWDKTVDEAQKMVIHGDIGEIKKIFDPYHTVSSKYPNMAIIYRQAYQVQLENCLANDKDKKNLESGIKKYLILFGMDDSIKTIAENYQQHFHIAMNLEMHRQGSIESWNPTMMISDICKAE